MQHQDQGADSNSGGPYSVKSCKKTVSGSLRAEHIQDVQVQRVKNWPRTESLSAEYKSLPHPASEGTEGNKIKMSFSELRRQWPEKNFFSQMKISSILRKFSISKLTEFMPQHLEKLMTRLQGSRRTIILLQSQYCSRMLYDTTTIKLHFCEKGVKISAKVYEKTVLEPVVKLFNNTLFSNGHWSFKQDLAHAHKANSTKIWLQRIFWTLLLQVIQSLLALQQLWLSPMDSKSGQCLKAWSVRRGNPISKSWSAPRWKQWQISQTRHCVIQ